MSAHFGTQVTALGTRKGGDQVKQGNSISHTASVTRRSCTALHMCLAFRLFVFLCRCLHKSGLTFDLTSDGTLAGFTEMGVNHKASQKSLWLYGD